MAKFGEGDKRWIVADRPDGANVHNWHWSERDCLDWSRTLLSSLLSNLTILDNAAGGLTIRTRTLDRLDGEAYVNVRKGKVIPGYELSLSLSWDAQTPDLNLSGTLDIPYLADENAGEDPEIRVTVREDTSPVAARVKEAFLAKGRPIILEKIRAYVRAMSSGGPAKDDLELKKPGAPKTASISPAATPAAAAAVAAKKKAKEGFKTISLTEKFNLPARLVYETLMDENRWKGFTQSNARISKEVGGEFSLFDGSVTGVNEELQDGKLIVQKWRFGSWADGIYSTVRLAFDEKEPGLTIVKLTQSNVPEEDKYGNATVVENTERGWRDLIFCKIHTVFGFGS